MGSRSPTFFDTQTHSRLIFTDRKLVNMGTNAAPDFLERLQSQTVRQGNAGSFAITVSGSPLPVVRWFREGLVIQSFRPRETATPCPSPIHIPRIPAFLPSPRPTLPARLLPQPTLPSKPRPATRNSPFTKLPQKRSCQKLLKK